MPTLRSDSHTVLFLCHMLAGLAGCAANPKTWSQSNSNGANSSFIGVHSVDAITPKWTWWVGKVFGLSPVIAPNGYVRVAITKGEVVNVTTTGKEVWRWNPPAPLAVTRIHTTPAIDSSDRTYVVVNGKLPGPDLEHPTRVVDILYCLETKGRLVDVFWEHEFEGGVSVISPPKIWEDSSGKPFVFVLVETLSPEVIDQIQVFDGPGPPVAMAQLPCAKPTGPGAPRLAIADPPRSVSGGFPIPIADTPRVMSWGFPIVVSATDGCPVNAFRWDDTIPALVPLWSEPQWPNWDPTAVFSSPAVSLDGLVFLAMGSSVHAGDGQQSRTALVRALDWRDGSLVWEHKICPPALGAICYHAGPPVGAPSLFLGQGNQVYVALHDELLSIELGSLKDTAVVRGSQGSPAATWDKVYLATAEGLRTFPFLLDRPPFSVVVDAGAPMTNDSSPSVGPDGTVYIVGDDGVLRAYAGPPN